MENDYLKRKIDELLSDLACCDRSGGRCFQAVQHLGEIRDYVHVEFMKHAKRVGISDVAAGASDADS